ncbi:MAG: efflux RND transporter periplasmic adaptor subunit [Cyanobacteriota bacterium]|nr:efflux RND transporter periplasmic adaptor subunit [Cyanobacteriota bacterium]
MTLPTRTPLPARPAQDGLGLPVSPPAAPPATSWWWKGSLTLLALTTLASLAWLGHQQLRQRADEQLSRLTVAVQQQDLTQRLRVSGQVQPIRQVNVSPRESGRLVELFVEQGDRVQAGQLLARMDYGDLQGGLVQAEGRIAELQARLAEQKAGEQPETLAAAQARLVAAESKRDLARTELERYRLLVAEGAIAQEQLDSKQANLEQAEADVQANRQELLRLETGTRQESIQQTEAQIRQAQGQLQQQRARILDTEVRAPFAGVVIQRYADVGAIVTPTTSASDSTAATSSSLLALAEGIEVRADVPEAQVGNVQVGQEVEIRTVAFPDQAVQGRVKRIAPATVVVKEVTIFRVTIEPQLTSDASRFLRAGMNVSVDFLGEPQPAALTVPAVALIYQDGQEGVILWDPQSRRPIYRPVQTGITQTGVTQVLTGLTLTDRVFTSLPPQVKLDDLIKQSPNQTLPTPTEDP